MRISLATEAVADGATADLFSEETTPFQSWEESGSSGAGQAKANCYDDWSFGLGRALVTVSLRPMPTSRVKRAYKYRFYPTPEQAAELARTFGCVRKVYNMALAARTEAWKGRSERIGYNATSALLTAWKKTEELAYLNDVSSVPLQQALRHLQTAFTNYFAKRAKYPRFKAKRKSRASAEYTRSAFRFRDGELTLAKMAEPLAIVWSRPLSKGAEPSTVTVSRDAAGRPGVDVYVRHHP
ncbi:hypothetical protein GCM10023196_064310 [Actinoallomurus vinaceus]|uniref:Transposase putative helix-turn-helix domain-containing protein n=1 Tax=Actinoallomurus vinaceus TaxID=1080074 RepID=A0ABP8UKG6_9ACTN